MKKYIERIGIAVSVLLNVLSGGASNQTLSARNYEWKRQGRLNFVFLIDLIFWLDEAHCCTSWAYWKVRERAIQINS
jgi:hypothetical protein